MPHRAPMAWPNRRCAHCHLPPRALPDAQPRQHGAQCAGHHNNQLYAPPTVLITRHQSCASRGRVRRTNASRFAHASSRLRFASRHPACSSFCSTHRSPACAACCTTSCKQHAREPLRGPGRRISKQDRMRSRSARAAIACARRQRRSHARQRQCEWLSVNGRWCLDRCLRRRPLPRRALIAPKRVGGGCMRVLLVRVVDPVWAVPASSPNQGAARGVGPRRRPRVAPTRPRAAEPRPSWQCGGGGGERGGECGRWPPWGASVDARQSGGKR